MEEQGIMGLGTPPQQGPSGEQLVEAAKSISPDDYAKGTMESLRMQDPESAAIVDQIMSMQLPADLVEALLELVDMIFQDPQNYPAIRQESIAAGVPEEILPPEFDVEYFAMLQMALRAAPRGPASPEMPDEPEIGMMAPQMSMPGMGQAPQRFAMGGEVIGDPKMKMVAQYLQDQGRYGDTMLAHINPQEATMLKQMGGSGTINPYTGLPEFFSLKKLGRKIGNAFKKAGRAVVKVVKDIGKGIQKIAKTPIGKIAIGVGIAILTIATGGAAAAAGVTGLSTGTIAGAVGGMGASLIAGDSAGDVVKNGLIGGTLGYGANKLGVTGFGGTGGNTGSFTEIAGNLGSTVYQKGRELISGSGKTNPDGTPEKGFLKQAGETIKDAKEVIAIGAPLLTLGAGGFDPAETSPDDLQMGFTGESPTRTAMDLIEANPERYKITMGDITQSRTEKPFAQTGAIDTSLPTVALPSIPVPGMPTIGQPQPPVPEMPQVAEYPSPFLPPSSGSREPTSPEMMYDPRTIALAEQYNIDLAQGFAAGGIVQHFAKGGSVSARMAREYEAKRSAASRAKSAASSKGKSSIASRVAKSKVNDFTNKNLSREQSRIDAVKKKYSSPKKQADISGASGSSRAAMAAREAAAKPKLASAPNVNYVSGKKYTPPSRTSPSASKSTTAAQMAAKRKAANAKTSSAGQKRMAEAFAATKARLEAKPAPKPTPASRPTPAPASRPTPAPALRPTPAPALRPTPAPSPVAPTPAPPINIGGATPAPPLVAPPPTPTPVSPAPLVAPPPTPTPVSPAPLVAPPPTPTPVSPAPLVAPPPTPTPVSPAPPVAPPLTPTASNPFFPSNPSYLDGPANPAFPTPTPTPVFPAPPQVAPSNPFFPSNPSYLDGPANPAFPGFGTPDASNPFIQGFNQGGLATMKQPVYGYVGGGTPQYPNRDGEIAGPGTGTSDDIPAMLSDGEFVFTAKAVRNLGGGDRKEGAKRMYAMMKKLEAGGMA
jgi:hypothetical protein